LGEKDAGLYDYGRVLTQHIQNPPQIHDALAIQTQNGNSGSSTICQSNNLSTIINPGKMVIPTMLAGMI